MAKIKLKNILPAVRQKFLLPCEGKYRIQITNIEGAPKVANPNSFICKLISEGCGAVVFTQPRFCAKCQFNGKINPKFIEDQITKRLNVALSNVVYGFYNPDEVKQVIKGAYAKLNGNMQGREKLRRVFESLVGTGKMPLKDAEAFIKVDLPELEKDEQVPESPARSGRIPRVVTKIPGPSTAGGSSGVSSGGGPAQDSS